MAPPRSIPVITIPSLRGGLDDNTPPTFLPADVCTKAENVEFDVSTLGERRMGCTAINLPTSISADAAITAITWMGKHLPTNTLGDTELWVLAQSLTTSANVLTRRTKTAWSTVTPNDAITSTSGYGTKLVGVSLHGKFYLAYKSAVDQLHVWDGTSLRKVGIAAPGAAPTAVDTAVGGTYASARYFRVRYVVLSGSTVLLRSEPSAVLTFTPNGSFNGAIVTKPAAVNQGETHWELEASTDNANFYMIARTIVATTTYTDTTAFATGYAAGGTLSEALTSYTLIPSGKFLSVDNDRLLIGGSFENAAYASRIWWTPVFGATGVGNDERLDMTVNPYLDLDGYEGGELTGLSRAVNGFLYAFKWSHIYKIVRTGQLTNAYSAIPITKARGAVPGSLVEAVDQAGNPAQYFLDPRVGPMRIGNYGIEWCGRDIQTLWSRINLAATVIAHGVFYPLKNQVHYWVALDGADYPNAKIILHCSEVQSNSEGARRGWVTVPVGDRIADAYCSIMFSPNIDGVDARSQSTVPFIGKKQWTVLGATIKDLIQRCDVGTTDAFTTGDTDAYYYASVQTRPFSPLGTINKYGLMSATILAVALNDATNDVYVKAIKDFGTEDLQVNIDLVPKGEETILIKKLDQLNFGELVTLQLAFGDLNTAIVPSTSWQLHLFTAKIREEQTS